MCVQRRVVSGLIALAVFLCALPVSTGQTLETTNHLETDRSRLDTLRTEGYEALYNLDYGEARRLFKEMAQSFPDHPAGPQSLAATLWLEELNRSRHLQVSLYTTESLTSRTDKVDPRTVDQFRQLTREAKLLAEARLKRNPRDVEALYFLGATDGLKAVFTAAIEQRFRAALSDSSRAVDSHKEVLKLDPAFRDAELTIGMYNYVVGSLPLPVKILASIGGMRGSKKRGLEMVERVAKEGRWGRDLARTLLIDLYKREKRWPDALAVARDLSERYPHNYLFQLQAADAIIGQATSLRQKGPSESEANAKAREAFAIFDSLLRDRVTPNATANRAADLIHFRYGEVLLMAGEPDRAGEEFLAAARVVKTEPALATLAHLRRAQAMDLAGKRREAMGEYEVVLKRPNVRRSHEEARRGLQTPYRKVRDIRW